MLCGGITLAHNKQQMLFIRRYAMDSERNREHEGATDRGSSNVGGGAPGMGELRMEDYGHDDSDPTLTGVEGPATTAGQPDEAQHSNVGGAQSGQSGQSGGSD